MGQITRTVLWLGLTTILGTQNLSLAQNCSSLITNKSCGSFEDALSSLRKPKDVIQCQEACKKEEDCKFFTFANEKCHLFEDCQAKTDCEQCLSGSREAKIPLECLANVSQEEELTTIQPDIDTTTTMDIEVFEETTPLPEEENVVKDSKKDPNKEMSQDDVKAEKPANKTSSRQGKQAPGFNQGIF